MLPLKSSCINWPLQFNIAVTWLKYFHYAAKLYPFNPNISCYFNRIIGRETKRYEDAENEKIATPQDREKSPPIKCQLLLSWNKSLYQHWYKLLQEWPVQTNERFTRDRLNKLNQYFNVADTSRNPPWRLPEHDKISTHVQLCRWS